jgi:polyisoprenoid-binding protein YceI
MKLTHLLLIPALLAAAADTPLEFSPQQAQVAFTLGDVLHTVHGTFALKRGNLHFDPETGKASGEIVVDATSGESGSAARDRRMHKNILESERFPEIVFHPDRVDGKVTAEGVSDAVLHGMFTIHGGSHELSAPVHVEAAGGRYTATAHFTIPYVKWGMKNPSTLILRVSDKVDIEVHLVAHVPMSASVSR